MKPLSEACTMMQDENCGAWGFHVPLIERTVKQLRGIENLVHCEPLKDALVFGTEKRFAGHKCLANLVATMLHPAFKRDYLAKNIEGIDIDLVVDKIVAALDIISTTDAASAPPKSAPLRHLSLFYDDTEIAAGVTQRDNRQLLETYFLETDRSTDVLLAPKYGKIKDLFIQFNTQLLSSASSER